MSEPQEVVLHEAIDVDQRRWVYSLSADQARALPSWSPEQGPPPLSISVAVAKAREVAQRRHAGSSALETSMIMLRHTLSCHPVVPVKWYYVIQVVATDRGEMIPAAGCVVVLMNGTVVTPTDSTG